MAHDDDPLAGLNAADARGVTSLCNDLDVAEDDRCRLGYTRSRAHGFGGGLGHDLALFRLHGGELGYEVHTYAARAGIFDEGTVGNERGFVGLAVKDVDVDVHAGRQPAVRVGNVDLGLGGEARLAEEGRDASNLCGESAAAQAF